MFVLTINPVLPLIHSYVETDTLDGVFTTANPSHEFIEDGLDETIEVVKVQLESNTAT